MAIQQLPWYAQISLMEKSPTAKNPVVYRFGVKTLDKSVSKDQKPSDLKDKNKGIISRIKKTFLQGIYVIVEVFSTIVGNIIG